MKEYMCPKCGKSASSDDWMSETRKHYEENEIILGINADKNSAFFYCPKCNKESDGEQIVEAGDRVVCIPKSEYKELLEIKAMYEDLCN